MSSKIDNICNDLFHTGRISFNEWGVITQGVTDYAHGDLISSTANAQQVLLSDEASDTPWAVDESPRCEDVAQCATPKAYDPENPCWPDDAPDIRGFGAPDAVDKALGELEKAYAVWFEKRSNEDRRKAKETIYDAVARHAEVHSGLPIYRPVCCGKHSSLLQRLTTMIVCPECGDKRCPKAANCEAECMDFETEVANAFKEADLNESNRLESISRLATEELLTDILKWATDYGVSKQSTRDLSGFVLCSQVGRNLPVSKEYAAVFEIIYKADYVGEYDAKD